MLKLLERSIASVDQRLTLLAPPGEIPSFFKNVDVDPRRHRQLFRAMQKLRGRVYLRDGAIEPHQLSADGLHETPEDEKCWHLLILNKDQQLNSCIWYLDHDNSVSVGNLRARNCSLARQTRLRDRFSRAVESEIAVARAYGIRYAESGGWAVSEGSRCSSEGLVLALAAFSLGNIFGGVLALSTATARHGSSTILRRLGGSPLTLDGQPIPSYYDPKYKCEMQLLRFESRRPSPQYMRLVDLLQDRLADALVLGAATYADVAPVYDVIGQASASAPRPIAAA